VSAPFTVRPFERHEWPLLRELRLRALADAPDAFARTVEEEQDRPDAEWARQLALSTASDDQLSLVAERAGRGVGLAYTRLDPVARDTAHLFSMWVAPEARRLGVGRALVAAVASWAQAHGARRLELRVTRGNRAAEQLYERGGLRFTGEVERLRAGSPLEVRTMDLDLGGGPVSV